jgi:copper(I)-binding protein
MVTRLAEGARPDVKKERPHRDRALQTVQQPGHAQYAPEQGRGLALLDYIDDETRRIAGKLDSINPEKPVLAAFTVSPDKPAGDVVAIMNSWVREAHADAKVNAGYMTLVNTGSEDVTLVKVESEAYDAIEVHEMTRIDGMMKMREVTDMVVPARGQIQFEPGGKHLMLMGPQEYLTTGQKVEMILTFESGKKQTVSVKVAAR